MLTFLFHVLACAGSATIEATIPVDGGDGSGGYVCEKTADACKKKGYTYWD